jgi:hypothetical protein
MQFADFFEGRLQTGNELDRRAAERENQARPAVVWIDVESNGVGRKQHDTIFTFHVPFLDEPRMTQGSAVLANPKPAEWYPPEGTAGVTAWVRDSSGLYTGAKLWTRVQTEPIGAAFLVPPGMRVQHWLRFEGVVVKDLGQSALNEAQSSQPRQVRIF